MPHVKATIDPALAPCPDPCPDAVRALELRLTEYLPSAQILKVRQAYQIGAMAHHGQTRKSGEAYITHPVAVAGILADLRLDAEALCAAILHDTLEDTPLPREQIVELFGETVAGVRHRSRDEVHHLGNPRFGQLGVQSCAVK